MSSLFQGLVTDSGEVKSTLDAPDSGSTYFRGMRIRQTDGAVHISTSAAIANYIGGVPVSDEGIVCINDTLGTPVETLPGALRIALGRLYTTSVDPPNVIHQGVGLRFDGRLCRIDAEGPNLIVNGDFADGITGWTVGPGTIFTFPGSWCQIENAVATPGYIGQIIATEPGVVYEVTLDSGANNGSTMKVNVDSTGYTFNGDLLAQVVGSSSSLGTAFTAIGPQSYFALYVNSGTAGRFVQADNVVVKKS